MDTTSDFYCLFRSGFDDEPYGDISLSFAEAALSNDISVFVEKTEDNNIYKVTLDAGEDLVSEKHTFMAKAQPNGNFIPAFLDGVKEFAKLTENENTQNVLLGFALDCTNLVNTISEEAYCREGLEKLILDAYNVDTTLDVIERLTQFAQETGVFITAEPYRDQDEVCLIVHQLQNGNYMDMNMVVTEDTNVWRNPDFFQTLKGIVEEHTVPDVDRKVGVALTDNPDFANLATLLGEISKELVLEYRDSGKYAEECKNFSSIAEAAANGGSYTTFWARAERVKAYTEEQPQKAKTQIERD